MWFQKLCRGTGKLIHEVVKPLPVKPLTPEQAPAPGDPKLIARRITTTVTTVEEVELHPPASPTPPE